MFRAVSQEPDGRAVFDKFKIRATPTLLFLAGDGAEVDWILGYDPPAEEYKKLFEKILRGEGTFKALNDAYAKNPKEIGTVYDLAGKWNDRYDQAKAAELYKAVLALDPDGKLGGTEYQGVKVPYAWLADFHIGQASLSARPPDAAPLLAFIKKYPEGPLVKDAYAQLARAHFGRTAPKTDAAAFFAEYVGRYPQDLPAVMSWVRRIIFDKEPLDKGLELASKAVDLAPKASQTMALQSLAQIHLLSGRKSRAAETAERILRHEAELQAEAPKDAAAPTRAAFMSLQIAAQIFIDADQKDRALTVFGPDFLKSNLDKPDAAVLYAQFWQRQGTNLESALVAAQKSVELAPDSYRGFQTMSQILMGLKAYDEALKAAEKALALAPARPPQLKDMIQKSIDQIKAAAAEKK